MPNYPYAKIQNQAISFSARAKNKNGGDDPFKKIAFYNLERESSIPLNELCFTHITFGPGSGRHG